MSKVVDLHGYITCKRVRANYDRIAHSNRMSLSGGKEAEAYLRLVLRLEKQGKWDHAAADLVRRDYP